MPQKKPIRIGVLTGGGDCPGLNAVIRSVAKTAIFKYKMEVVGILDSYQGLVDNEMIELQSSDVSGILHLGGTILGTDNKANPFRVPVVKGKKVTFRDESDLACAHFKKAQLDALIAIGGDGTLAVANQLAKKGIPVIGVPKTIDNDLSCTDYTFGFDTAVNITTEALDRLHTTASSHHRVMILEVMGRNAGFIALYAGMAGGADVILIPEIPFETDKVCEIVKERSGYGKRYSLIVVAEGAKEKGGEVIVKRNDPTNPYPIKLGGVGNYLREKIEKLTGLETRAANLGHIQRGGSPTAFDRNLGTLFGHHAVELVKKKHWNQMVCYSNNEISSIPIGKAVAKIKTVKSNHRLIRSGKAIGINFGT